MKKILILATISVLLFTGISVGYASSPVSSTALVQLPAPLVAPFKDVKTTDFFAPYVDALKAEGILGGYANGTFKPGSPLNRAEFATALGRSNALMDGKMQNLMTVICDGFKTTDFSNEDAKSKFTALCATGL
ncbi:MAG: hypothetical protein US89_C0001G0058 [Candidatus Peregrinibacteria bacterium GW2011_GWF2_38_29]|nr:MAG: hypothetical protein US89_C0001G0058 [Candidatus Peregrinibacteria bacterium GW2011_GWF2_38_29]HBB03093.1 hypothetical protein [Candidatus Peregrinibacteria bacterium]